MKLFILKNASENIICEMAANLSMGRLVNNTQNDYEPARCMYYTVIRGLIIIRQFQAEYNV